MKQLSPLILVCTIVPPVNLKRSETMGLAHSPSPPYPTLEMLTTLVVALSSVFKTRAALQLENVALRHQLGVLRRSVKKPKFTPLDQLLWAWLCGVWLTGAAHSSPPSPSP